MKEKEIRRLLMEKEGIETLNPMQEKMLQASNEKRDLILLSPTGSGKTVAFGVPLVKMLKDPTGRVQALVIAPSRELVLQIASVLRNIGWDFRTVAVYGGHNVEDEVNSLKVVPDIIVGTPGRVLDQIKRGNIDPLPIRILVLDEFDKSLELGFEEDMSKIVRKMKNVSRLMLTSATNAPSIPDFLPISNPVVLDFLEGNKALRHRMQVRSVRSSGKDKLESLHSLLKSIASDAGVLEKSIVFVNHRESAERVAEYLKKHGVSAVLYHGALEQRERESALAAFNSGAKPVLVATDLAARGLDISGVQNVLHYHLPLSAEAYTHRNGRTARIANEGNVYLLLGPEEEVKDYIEVDSPYSPAETDGKESAVSLSSGLETLHITGGKREKVSKGDILGFITKEAGVPATDVGKIDVFDHYSLVTVNAPAVGAIIATSKQKKLKGDKRKITVLE